ncbi:MAG: aspartate--ammonia ligase, partial [Bacilli bacterium]
MMSLIIPRDYRDRLSIRETQVAIKLAKDTFERKLAKNLNLTRVSAPLFVYPESGLNDNLSGVERPVSFEIKATGKTAEIVQSLAKWKRLALTRYGFKPGEGLYTDMNAIRRDEELDNLHSIYVDQWDWEIVITREERDLEYLKKLVRKIVLTLKETKGVLSAAFPALSAPVNDDVYFISSEELRARYPDLSPKEREDAICRERGVVFISEIGHRLG